MSTDAPPAPPPVVDAPPPTPPPGNNPPSVSNPPPSSGIDAPWASKWIKSDFTLDHAALERLPEHLKGIRPVLERHKNFEDVLTTFQNQQFLNGKKALAPLPADSPKEVIAERKALMDSINGVPADIKGYGIAKPADLPDHVWHQPLADGVTTWGHKHSVSPAALKELIGMNGEFVKGQLANQAQEETKFWGAEQEAFDATIRRENIPSDRASALVEKGAIALGLDMTSEKTKTFLRGSDARLMALRHAVAIGEDRASTPGAGGGGMGGDPGELAADVRRNPANPLHAAYWNKDGKASRQAQEAAVEKVNGWERLASERRKK